MMSALRTTKTALQALFGFSLVSFVIAQDAPAERGKDSWWDDKYPPQPYAYGYKITDDDGNQQWKREISNGHVVRGSYGFTGPDGLFRQVDYIADENGYRAIIRTNEPGTDAQNPASVTLYANPPVNPQNVGFSQRGSSGDQAQSSSPKAARHIDKRMGLSAVPESDSWDAGNQNVDSESDGDIWSKKDEGSTVASNDPWSQTHGQRKSEKLSPIVEDSWTDRQAAATESFEPWKKQGIWRSRDATPGSWATRQQKTSNEKRVRGTNYKKVVDTETNSPVDSFWDDGNEDVEDHAGDVTTPNSLTGDAHGDEHDLAAVSKTTWNTPGDHRPAAATLLNWRVEQQPVLPPLRNIWDHHSQGISSRMKSTWEDRVEPHTSPSMTQQRKFYHHQGPMFVTKYVWE